MPIGFQNNLIVKPKPKPKRRATQKPGELREEITLRRVQARFSTMATREAIKAHKAMLSTYAAADRGRKNKDWKATTGSADAAIIPDAPLLNARARQMVRDNWAAKSVVKAFVRNVIGCGIIPVPQAKDAGGKLLEKTNRRLMLDFWDWAGDKQFCDVEQRQTFWQKQGLVESERVTVGGSLIAWSYAPNCLPNGRIDLKKPVGLRLQSIEYEQLYTNIQSCEGNEVRGGVEVDDCGRPVAYHVYTHNPNDYLSRKQYAPVRIPAERVWHIYRQERVSQTLGITELAPVLQDLRDLARFKDATLWRAIMESCIGVIIKQSTPGGTGGLSGITPRTSGDSGTTASGMRTMDFVPGMAAVLNPNEDVSSFMPQAPGSQYEPFTRLAVRSVAAGTGLSYGQVSRDFTQGTFSGQRQEMLEDSKEFDPLQELHALDWVCPAYRLWVCLYVAEGRAPELPDFESAIARYAAVDYVVPPKNSIDPKADAEANEKLLANRLISREELAHRKGMRLTDILTQLAAEKREAEANGLTFPEDEANAPAPNGPDPELERIKAEADAYGVAVRAGAVTPQTADEGSFRQKFRLPAMSAEVEKAWTDDGGIRRPTTIQQQGGGSPFGGGGGGFGGGDAAVDETKPADTTKAKLAEKVPATNYRPAETDALRCSTCDNAVGMYCKAHDFNFTVGFVCDDFAAEPVGEQDGVGRAVVSPPGPQEGDREVDDPRSDFLDEAKRGVLAEQAALIVPSDGEKHDDFIHRFMSDKTMMAEYPDQKQRYAVAESYWEKRSKAK
jgi:lambda family phage portal protein